MKKHLPKYLLLTLLILPLTAATAPPEPETTTQPGPGRLDLRSFLRKYGKLHSIYFTMEQDFYDYGPGQLPPFLQSHYLRDPEKFENNDALFDALRRALPEAEVKEDNLDPKFVHIRVKSLSRHKNLFLDQKATLTFDGKVKDLLDTLAGHSEGRFKADRSGAIPYFPYDEQAHTKIDVKDQTYRALISKAIPPNTDHILWEAVIQNEKDSPVTYLHLNNH